MNAIKVIGKIKEVYGENYPSIRDLISDTPIEGKEKILTYFKEKPTGAVSGSLGFEDFITGEQIMKSLYCSSDGDYGWRSDTVYFFEKYNLELPEEFIKHVLGK